MEYAVIVSSSLTRLLEDVNTKLKDGWNPQGGLMFVNDNYFQAIIKPCGS
jgi:hypothetical protein